MRMSLKWNNVLFALFFAMSVSSCLDMGDSAYEKQAKIDDDKINEYLNLLSSNIPTKHFTGFYYQALTPEGSGAALVRGDVVDFYYKISKLDGTVIEDSMSAKKPAQLKLLDYSIVPEALDRGISLMKVGSKYRFYIPSYLAYGDYHSSLFPSNTNFIVDILVVKKQSETDLEVAQLDSIDTFVKSNFTTFEKFASGLYYIDNVVGTGIKPRMGDRVVINMTRKYLDGTVIKTVDNLILNLGYGQAVQGLEEGLMQMREGGKAVFVMPASIAFKQSLCLIPQKVRTELLEDKLITSEVNPYSIVQYIVELKTVN